MLENTHSQTELQASMLNKEGDGNRTHESRIKNECLNHLATPPFFIRFNERLSRYLNRLDAI